MPEARFVIVGDAPPGFEDYKKKVIDAVAENGLGDRVLVTNATNAEIPEVVASLDVLAAPSYVESCSYSILEGMAMGKPVLASDAGGNPEIVGHDNTGLVVPVGDQGRLAEAAEALIADSDRRERARRRGAQMDRIGRHAGRDGAPHTRRLSPGEQKAALTGRIRDEHIAVMNLHSPALIPAGRTDTAVAQRPRRQLIRERVGNGANARGDRAVRDLDTKATFAPPRRARPVRNAWLRQRRQMEEDRIRSSPNGIRRGRQLVQVLRVPQALEILLRACRLYDRGVRNGARYPAQASQIGVCGPAAGVRRLPHPADHRSAYRHAARGDAAGLRPDRSARLRSLRADRATTGGRSRARSTRSCRPWPISWRGFRRRTASMRCWATTIAPTWPTPSRISA